MNKFGVINPSMSMNRKMKLKLGSEGLGSLRHTMPHLRRLTAGSLHFQGGGAMDNPVGRLYAASQPNRYNPDPRFRAILEALSQPGFTNPNLRTMPGGVNFVYQEGGPAPEEEASPEAPPPDMSAVESPEDQLSPDEQQQREVVLEALAALEGQSPDPHGALKRFTDIFGPAALRDLQQLLEEHHQQQPQASYSGEEDEEDDIPDDERDPAPEEEEEPEEEDSLTSAGGGLLRGPGTGQSDEIEGSTPSGRPVLLSDGEYVIDAPTVAALGDGSTHAGARRLDELRKQIRRDAYGNDKQAKPMAKGGRALVLRIP